ncbi:pericentriolar material 1 protein isoform X2 [Esox lucius]|uniref:pericentriolar material 1 protein isoform X2 n=1 Tax=Esox lucius TaxID=8010 RepID=UPI001476A6EF|nr:pericentriolar material 1 protein isoform X2 [Esox lucius]
MATGGTSFDEQELHNWTVTNGSSLEDRLNNMDWGVQQKKANRSSEKNRKKFSAGGVTESRLTNDISPESTPGAGRRRARTPHSFPHVKYTTQMSVPDQAELDRLRQRINFTDLDERSIGSDSQGRVTAANNQRQLAAENKKPFNFLPLHVNTNKSREAPSASAPSTPSVVATAKKQSPGSVRREAFAPSLPGKDLPGLGRGAERLPPPSVDDGRDDPNIDSSQVVSKLVQIREYIGKASSMRDDLVEKNDIPANVERLSHLIAHLKEQERSYLRFLQKMLARENEEDEAGTMDSALGSGSLPESTSLNIEVRSSDASNATGRVAERSDQKEELENLRRQHELLKKMLEQQEQLRALQGRQAALLAMQHTSQHAVDDTVPTETTGSVSGLSITSELNEELNDLIQRFHNQLHDTQTKAVVPDNRRQAESLSLSREVCRSRSSQPPPRSSTASSSFLHPTALTSAPPALPSAASAKLTKLQELQDKKQTMDKILQELHSLRDQTLNNNSCRVAGEPLPSQQSLGLGSSSDRPSALYREPNGASAMRQDPSPSYRPSTHPQHEDAPADKLRKLKEVHKRLNELRELVQYYEQTSDMMVDTVNENVKEDDEEEDEEETEEDGSMLEAMFDSEQENRRPPVTNIRNPQHPGNWTDMNSLTNGRGGGGGGANNRSDGRLNTECEINNRSAAANLRSLNIPSAIECQYNSDRPYNQVKDHNHTDRRNDDDDALEDEERVPGRRGQDSEGSGSSQRSSLANDDADFAHKVHRLQTAKQKLRQLQELVAMVQSDDTDATTANEDESLRHQQPNNTRAAASSAAKSPRDLALTDKAREKLYEEKLRQQQQELKQLHEERQRLMEIQDKIQDLQWACPDLQSSVSSSSVGQQALMRKLPAAASTPAPPPAPSAPPKAAASPASAAVLKPTAQASASVTDNELWCEMRRHQILREELRQRRKHLESLMAEHQRRSGLSDSPYRPEDPEGNADGSQPLSRDERTMATWGDSSLCQLEEDGYPSETGAEEEEEEEEEEGAESSSSDDQHLYSTRKQRSYSNRKQLGSKLLKPPRQFASDASGRPFPRAQARAAEQQSQSNVSASAAGARRQENLRWASELSFQEGPGTGARLAPRPWQEQAAALQRQLDFSTGMCQTLLQDQQTLSYMLQTLLTGPYSALPNNLSSPQVHLVMHQLSQCYTQLAWQQNNVQRLKQVLSDMLLQQQQASSSGQQAPNQGSSSRESGGACPPLSPTSLFLPFPSSIPPSVNQALSLPPGFSGFSPLTGFNFNPLFPSAMGEFPQCVGAPTSSGQHQQQDPNTSVKTEYMSFPPPLQRSPLNTADKRPLRQDKSGCSRGHESGWLDVSQPPDPIAETPSAQRGANNGRPLTFDLVSQGSFSSTADPADPATVTKTFKAGRKASAQASLASRDKTPNSKRRSRRAKEQHKNPGPEAESDSVSSMADFVQERAPLPHRKRDQNQSLLDKLTQEKLDSKTKTGNKPNDLSSAYAWRTPFLSNRIACTEAPDASSDFSLFEALRETIYSEVATLISQNESRPHFLIELFHELQLLNTDYLRQRALYSLQDIVTRHLTEKNASEERPSSLGPVAWAAGSQSELTPSESLATSDADVSEKNVRVIKHNDPNKRRNDADSVDNESTLSTSSNLEPFANDDLGNTVIHLDKALARMREYERMKLKAELTLDTAAANAPEASANSSTSAAQLLAGAGGESGDVRCPQIDTQQLDRQIKAIMTEVIPFLKEHMDEVCSYQLLTSVRRMVLTLTQQNDESKEFVRFFHRQLGGILQDSLSKFTGRTLKDCGEDLLVEISEILFNELAFFRLMQDLDNNSRSVAATSQTRHRNNSRPPPKNNNQQVNQTHRNNQELKASEAEKSFSTLFLDEDKDQDETELREREEEANGGESKDSKSSEASEDDEGLPLSISLSKAETQALTNYGSGEDENEVEEMEEFEEGVPDVQTSLQASNDGGDQQGTIGNHETKSDPESSESNDAVKSSKSESIEVVDSPEEEHDGEGAERRRPEGGSHTATASAGAINNQEVSDSQVFNSSSPDTESPVMINSDEVVSGNTSQKSDEEDFVKVEDLPMQLSVLCQEELQKRIVEEQRNNNLTAEILSGNTDTLDGLVGSGDTLREPETVGAQSA